MKEYIVSVEKIVRYSVMANSDNEAFDKAEQSDGKEIHVDIVNISILEGIDLLVA